MSKFIRNLVKYLFFYKMKSKVILDKNKYIIYSNNKENTDLSIITKFDDCIIEIGRYTDDDAEYLMHHVKEILDYIQED